MEKTNATVAIVVDPDFGDRLLALASQMPVWIADTPANHTCAESLWSSDAQKQTNVTTFRVTGGDAADWCRMILAQIDLHHGEHSQSPPYRSIEVFGAAATTDLRRCFRNMALQYWRNDRMAFAPFVNLCGPTHRWTRGSIASFSTGFVDFIGSCWRSPASTPTFGGS
jgi:hypothetical protein